jgi:hypothetical protein
MVDQKFTLGIERLNAVGAATGSSLQAFVVGEESGKPLVVASVLLGASLTTELLTSVQAKATALADLAPRYYAPAAELSRGEVMWVESEVGSLKDVDAHVEAADTDVYDPAAAYAKNLKFLVVRVKVANQVIKFYRSLHPTSWLARSKKIAIFWQDGYFDKLETENVLLFDGKFDVVVAAQIALFTSKYTFERIFDFETQMAKASKATFTAITVGLRIHGLQEMEDACTSNPGMMAKLASIQRNLDTYPQYAAAMKMEKLLPFISRHPETGVETIGAGAGAELVFHNDPARRFKILRLLDDDFLQSELTSNTYEANSKSEPLA